MRKWMLVLVVVVLIMVMTSCGNKKSFSMDQVDARAYVMPDGDLYVEELFTYTFKGDFQGTTRYIDKGKHGGIEFFEAYVPPQGKNLGEFSYENLDRLNVEWDGENDTYYIHNTAKDEVKQVYYRYRIDKAAVKYNEMGKLDWKFFDNSNQDIHHVTLDVFLPSNNSKDGVYAFLHDRTGGKVTAGTEAAAHYENPKLSKQGDAEIVVLFPSGQLSQMTASEGNKPLQPMLAAEKKREDRMALRDGRMQDMGRALQVMTVICLLGALLYLLSWKRISAWMNRQQVSKDELDQLDPLAITYIFRKSKLQQKEFISGLLSLQKRGLVTVKEVPSSKRFQQEPTAPDVTLRFIFQGNVDKLNEEDRHLVKWLFEDRNGSLVFTLDSVAGPTFKERQNGKLAEKYHKAALRNASQFAKWSSILKKTKPYADYIRINPLLKLFIPLLVAVHYGLLIYLYYVDVAPPISIALIILLLGAGGVWTSIKYKSKLWIVLYHAVCFVLGSLLAHEAGSENYIVFVIFSALFAAVIPKYVMSWQTQQYRFALKDWRRKLAKNGASLEADPESQHADWNAQYAILLGMISKYVNGQKNMGTANVLSSAVPLLYSMDLLASMEYTQNHLSFRLPSSSSSDSSGGSYSGDGGGGGGTGAF